MPVFLKKRERCNIIGLPVDNKVEFFTRHLSTMTTVDFLAKENYDYRSRMEKFDNSTNSCSTDSRWELAITKGSRICLPQTSKHLI